MGKQKCHKAYYNTSKTSKNKYKRTEEQSNKPNDSIAHLTNNGTIHIKGKQWIGRNREDKGVGFRIRNHFNTLIEESNIPPKSFLKSQ